MASVRPIRAAPPETVALHTRAMDNLRFIRETMERAGSFTAVPGWGGLAMGATAVVAGLIAGQASRQSDWLTVWVLESLLAALIGIYAMHRKARRANSLVLSTPGRKFALSFVP